MTRPLGFPDNKQHIQADYDPMRSADAETLQPSHPDDVNCSFGKLLLMARPKWALISPLVSPTTATFFGIGSASDANILHLQGANLTHPSIESLRDVRIALNTRDLRRLSGQFPGESPVVLNRSCMAEPRIVEVGPPGVRREEGDRLGKFRRRSIRGMSVCNDRAVVSPR
jgi:hypothetical protein